MSISPICISFKGQMSAEKSIVTNSIDKAAEVAEKNFKTPEDSFTKNSTDVHCAFWNNLSNPLKRQKMKNGGSDNLPKMIFIFLRIFFITYN